MLPKLSGSGLDLGEEGCEDEVGSEIGKIWPLFYKGCCKQQPCASPLYSGGWRFLQGGRETCQGCGLGRKCVALLYASQG